MSAGPWPRSGTPGSPRVPRWGTSPPLAYHWNDVAFTPDGRYLLTPQAGGAVGVWDATTLEPVRTLGTLDHESRR